MDELGLIYAQLGEEKLRAMVAAFYRQVATDDLLGPMYPPEDFAAAEHRLAGFLIFRFGGPQTYIEERGHPRLKMRHFPFVINGAARDRWLKLMNSAMEEAQIPESTKTSLGSFFTLVAHNMQNSTDG